MPAHKFKKEITKCIPSNASFQKQIMYSFTDNDIVEKTDEYLLYRFPYSPHTFWVNFKYACFNQYGIISLNTSMKILLKTTDGYEYTLHNSEEEEYPHNKWCHTHWPIPSVKLPNPNESGIFFRLDFLQSIPNYQLKIDLQGFTHLYPDAKQYFLMNEFKKYQYLFMNLYHNPFLPYHQEHDVILSIEEEFQQHTDIVPYPEFNGIHIKPFAIHHF
jgi:hypothetical protein